MADNRKMQHYINISLQGGETNTLTAAAEGYDITDKAGAGGGLSVAYELTKGNFFFNVGVGADYQWTGQHLEAFTDEFERIDFEGEALLYHYNYSDFRERQRTLLVSIPVQFGYWVHPYIYLAVGAKIGLPVMATYSNSADMYTDGVYDRFLEPFSNVPQYGYYSTDRYSYSNNSMSAVRAALPQVAATIELGGRIPVKMKKHQLRAGVFAEYAFPFGSLTRGSIADYSAVDTNPYTQSQEQLRQTFVMNSVLDSYCLKRLHQNLTVGLKITLQLNVTRNTEPCRCEGY